MVSNDIYAIYITVWINDINHDEETTVSLYNKMIETNITFQFL